MSVSNQRGAWDKISGVYEKGIDAVILELRSRAISKEGWEKDRRGARLAPHIDKLRNTFGYQIDGTGTEGDPYHLIDRAQRPTLVPVTDELKNQYYQTSHWRSVRARRLAFDNHRCVMCGTAHDLQVHHWRYELFREGVRDLMTLCEDCHTGNEGIHKLAGVHVGWPGGIPPELVDRINRPVGQLF